VELGSLLLMLASGDAAGYAAELDALSGRMLGDSACGGAPQRQPRRRPARPPVPRPAVGGAAPGAAPAGPSEASGAAGAAGPEPQALGREPARRRTPESRRAGLRAVADRWCRGVLAEAQRGEGEAGGLAAAGSAFRSLRPLLEEVLGLREEPTRVPDTKRSGSATEAQVRKGTPAGKTAKSTKHKHKTCQPRRSRSEVCMS
jgi:hypothetical protein